ncbi:hypothetical protein [Streptosporangium sp. NPDC020145]|uniref:hypothetical protein n=1 Tax=Streptosporangium sp. NPDC020145 TaxID=3154694 RepID=UPI00343250FB
MKVDYEREMSEWSQATAKHLGETWREIVAKERPSWVAELITPKLHPKADDHIVWMLTSDQATLLLQVLRKGSIG